MPRKKVNSMPRLINNLNYDPKWFKGETNEGVSETIPDDAMSVKEMLYRHTHGMPVNIRNYEYFENYDEVPPHLRPGFDLTDIDDIREQLDFINHKVEDHVRNRNSSRSERTGDVSTGIDPEENGSVELSETGGSQHRDGEIPE